MILSSSKAHKGFRQKLVLKTITSTITLLLFVLGLLQYCLRCMGRERYQNVWIASHRRSGTHLTMDVIAEAIDGPLRIVKMNHVSATTDELSCDCLDYLRTHGKIVYPYRDIRDVVVSTYFYYQSFRHRAIQNMSISEFVQNKGDVRNQVIRSWAKSTRSWMSQPDVLTMKYEETVTAMPFVFEMVAHHLGKGVKNYTLDPSRMKSASQAVARGFGKGPGGWRSVMSGNQGDQILQLGRKISLEFMRQNGTAICGIENNRPRKGVLDHVWYTMNNMHTMWVGGHKRYGLSVPNYCPKELLTSTVVLTRRSAHIWNKTSIDP